MGEVARRLDQPHTVTEQLELVLAAACGMVPGAEQASITVLHRDGRAETLVCTAELARDLDQVQYDLDEGPCLDA
jgi:hypothetical protein